MGQTKNLTNKLAVQDFVIDIQFSFTKHANVPKQINWFFKKLANMFSKRNVIETILDRGFFFFKIYQFIYLLLYLFLYLYIYSFILFFIMKKNHSIKFYPVKCNRFRFSSMMN